MSTENAKWKYVGQSAVSHELYGVGGWLIVFCVGTLFGALVDLGRVISAARRLDMSLGDYLAVSHPSISLLKINLLYEIIAVALIYWMAFSKSPNFRNYSSAILLGSLPFMAVAGLLNPFEGLGVALASGLIQWGLSSAVWVSYLQRSTRVRVTFEQCIPEEPQKIQNHNQPLIFPGPEHSSTIAPAVTGEEACVTIPASDEPEEQFWAIALSECDEQKMRPGLWAKAFAESKGQEVVAKAQYMSLRAMQLQLEHNRLQEQEMAAQLRAQQAEAAQQKVLEPEQAAALAEMCDAERIEALKPKGRCPNCSAVIALESQSCVHCNAIFENDSTWQVQELSFAEQATLRVSSKAMHSESQTETSGDSLLPSFLIAISPFIIVLIILVAYK